MIIRWMWSLRVSPKSEAHDLVLHCIGAILPPNESPLHFRGNGGIANFVDEERYRVNVVQCRPLQVAGGGVIAEVPEDVGREDVVLEAHGAVIGQSRRARIGRVIYVAPSVYGQLPVNERYAVARLVGRAAHLEMPAGGGELMLLGPGRWGTTTPSLGVPVSFAEINRVGVLCEIVAMREDLVPDVSLGTHFFSEMVEMDVLYLALFPNREDSVLRRDFFEGEPNRLAELLPEATRYEGVVRVMDVGGVMGAGRNPKGTPNPTHGDEESGGVPGEREGELEHNGGLVLHADTLRQKVVCYRERGR